ncbi:AHH domain-containing protein [Archangium sp.]|uniref:AHH domain-containing protein n=1 Tax=Archangium sp. TaxID=1872627 RepID=UPI002ED87F24
MPPRVSWLYQVLLLAMSGAVLMARPAGASEPPPSRTVQVREVPGGLRLLFEPMGRAPGLEKLTVEQARGVLVSFREDFGPVRGAPSSREARVMALAALACGAVTCGSGEEWEKRLRAAYVAKYGVPEVALPSSLASDRLAAALRLSPRYMKEGVREAAVELFGDPLFLAGVSTSVVAYFLAWAVPEPLFSKTVAVVVTVGLVAAFGVVELHQLGVVCLRLYQEAEAAKTPEELEKAAEHFGKGVGGVALRALVMAASAGVAKGLPKVPKGGLWESVAPARQSLPGGLTLSVSTTAQVVADGTVVLMGAAVGTGAAAARVTGACGDGSKKDGSHWHHLATNKNDLSHANGGPWTPAFKKVFDKAGMSLEAKENLVYLQGHQGPHPEAYHQEIFRRLRIATEECKPLAECRSMLVEELDRIAGHVCTPGSALHTLLTAKP